MRRKESNLRLRVRAMILLLALVGVWPVVHRVWVHQSGVSPWKFFGWAMYTTPRFKARFEFRALDVAKDGVETPTVAGSLLRYPARRPLGRIALARYRQDELAWVGRTDPSDLVRAVFAAYPRVERLELTRRLHRYDPDVSLPVEDVEVRVFDRSTL